MMGPSNSQHTQYLLLLAGFCHCLHVNYNGRICQIAALRKFENSITSRMPMLLQMQKPFRGGVNACSGDRERGQKWLAQIMIDEVNYRIGFYSTNQQAVEDLAKILPYRSDLGKELRELEEGQKVQHFVLRIAGILGHKIEQPDFHSMGVRKSHDGFRAQITLDGCSYSRPTLHGPNADGKAIEEFELIYANKASILEQLQGIVGEDEKRWCVQEYWWGLLGEEPPPRRLSTTRASTESQPDAEAEADTDAEDEGEITCKNEHVYWDGVLGKWQARKDINGIQYNIGTYDEDDEDKAGADAAKILEHLNELSEELAKVEEGEKERHWTRRVGEILGYKVNNGLRNNGTGFAAFIRLNGRTYSRPTLHGHNAEEQAVREHDVIEAHKAAISEQLQGIVGEDEKRWCVQEYWWGLLGEEPPHRRTSTMRASTESQPDAEADTDAEDVEDRS